MKNFAGLPHALLTTAALIWGGNFIAAKTLIPYLDPFLINAIRWPCAAILIFILYSKQMKKDWLIIKSNLGIYILLALSGQVANQLLLTIGLQHSTVINALIWMSTAPAFISIFNYLFFKEKINLMQISGLGTGIFAIILLMTKGDFSKITFNDGDEYFILASLSWALYCCFSAKKDKNISDQSNIGFCAIIASFFLIPVAIIANFISTEPLIININSTTALGMLYQIIFPSLLAYYLFSKGIDKVGSGAGGMYTNLITIFGIGLSMLFLGERIELYHLTAGILVIMSIAMCSKAKTSISETKEFENE